MPRAPCRVPSSSDRLKSLRDTIVTPLNHAPFDAEKKRPPTEKHSYQVSAANFGAEGDKMGSRFPNARRRLRVQTPNPPMQTGQLRVVGSSVCNVEQGPIYQHARPSEEYACALVSICTLSTDSRFLRPCAHSTATCADCSRLHLHRPMCLTVRPCLMVVLGIHSLGFPNHMATPRVVLHANKLSPCIPSVHPTSTCPHFASDCTLPFYCHTFSHWQSWDKSQGSWTVLVLETGWHHIMCANSGLRRYKDAAHAKQRPRMQDVQPHQAA